MALAPK